MVEMEEKAGSLFEEGWFEALAIQKVSEATGEPAKLVTGFCNTDESTTRAIHM